MLIALVPTSSSSSSSKPRHQWNKEIHPQDKICSICSSLFHRRPACTSSLSVADRQTEKLKESFHPTQVHRADHNTRQLVVNSRDHRLHSSSEFVHYPTPCLHLISLPRTRSIMGSTHLGILFLTQYCGNVFKRTQFDQVGN